MALADLLALSEERNTKQGISEERIVAQMDNLRTMIAFFREYPDLFVDFIKGPDSTFNFLFYQRML